MEMHSLPVSDCQKTAYLLKHPVFLLFQKIALLSDAMSGNSLKKVVLNRHFWHFLWLFSGRKTDNGPHFLAFLSGNIINHGEGEQTVCTSHKIAVFVSLGMFTFSALVSYISYILWMM